MEYNLLNRLCKVLEKAAKAGEALTTAGSGVSVNEVCTTCLLFISNIGYPGVTPDADSSLVSRCTVALLRCANTAAAKAIAIAIAIATATATLRAYLTNAKLLVMLLQTLCRINSLCARI